MKKEHRALIFAGTAILLWSSVASVFKLALDRTPVFNVVYFSVLFSFLALTLILVTGNHLQALKSCPKKTKKILLALGILNPALYYLILFSAYDRLPAQYAQVANYTWPVVITLFGFFINRHKLRPSVFAGLIISFAGAVIVVTGGRLSSDPVSAPGLVLAFGSAFIWAFYWLKTKNLSADPVVSLWLPFLSASILLTPAAFFYCKNASFSLEMFLGSAYIGLFEMSLTFLLWLGALKNTSRLALVSNLVYLAPFLSLVFIFFILKEPIHPMTVTGLTLIVSGILWQVLSGKKS